MCLYYFGEHVVVTQTIFCFCRSGLISNAPLVFWQTGGGSSKWHLVQSYQFIELMQWLAVFAHSIIIALTRAAQHHQRDINMTA